MAKYKKPKVGFLEHVDGKQDKKETIDEVLKEASSNPTPEPKPKAPQKKRIIKEEQKPSAPGMSSYVEATKVDPNSAKGSFDESAVEGYVPPVYEETKPQVNAAKMTAYQKAVQEREIQRKKTPASVQEAADLLGGEPEKPVTQADLRQIKVALSSLGGGGLGEQDVIDLVRQYGADSIGSVLDSDQIQQIIEAITPLQSTDSLPEGLSNLYYTDARVDSNFALKTTDDLTEGSTNLYYTDSRSRDAIQSIDSALIYDKVTGNLAINSNHPDFDHYKKEDFDSDFALMTTDSLAEGVVNLYYTDSRARASIQSIDSSLIYDSTTGNLSLAIDPDDFYTTVDFDSDFLTNTTDSLAEGVTNLYYTTARHDSDTLIQVDSDYVNARVDRIEDTDSLAEGVVNLYYTTARHDSDTLIQVDSDYVNARVDRIENTDSLPEGIINLYYTDSRARSAIQSIDSALIYDSTTGDLSLAFDPDDFYTTVDFDSDFLTKTTDSLMEGDSNLYFKEERVQHMFYWAKAIEDIALGDAVQFAGAEGSHLLIRKADMTLAGFAPHHVMGIAKEEILDQHFGYVASFGQVRQVDVTGFSNGDILYLDPTTPGGLTNNKPVVPDHLILLAAVTDDDPANNGTVQVRLSHEPDTDEVPEGLNNLYWTQSRFDSAFDSTGIRALHDSLSSRVDSDDIEIQTLKNRVDDLDLQTAIVLNFDKQLAYDSATDSLDVGNYAIHFTGGGTDYLSVDKLFFNHIDKYGNASPMSIIDSGDILLLQDSDGGVARYIVSAYDDRTNHHEFDVTVEVASGAPADQVSVKAYPEQNLGDLATYNYVDAQDKILQNQIDNLDSALDSEHAWNVSEHSKLSSGTDSNLDSEHAWNVVEHSKLDSDLSILTNRADSEHAWNVVEHKGLSDRLDSDYAWNVAEHTEMYSQIDSNHTWTVDKFASLDSDVDSDINSKVSKSGDHMTGNLTLVNPARLSANNIGGVGNSNLNIKRDNDTKIQITSNYNNQFQKARYNADYGVDSDLEIPHKKYVDDAILVEHNLGVSADDSLQGQIDSNHDWTVEEIDKINSVDYLPLTGGTLTGQLKMADGQILLSSTGRNINVEFGTAGRLQYSGGTRFQWGNAYSTIFGTLNINDGQTYTGDSVQGMIDMHSNFIKNLPEPTLNHHAATKRYVDSEISNAAFEFDSSQFVDATGDSMSGALTIRREQTGSSLIIARDEQDRIIFSNSGQIMWTSEATSPGLSVDGKNFSVGLEGSSYFALNGFNGTIDIYKGLNLNGADKTINVPNNADEGQLQSNNRRRLYWNENNVGIDVGLEMDAQINMNGGNGRNKIVNLADPSDDYHAANKKYVDIAVSLGGTPVTDVLFNNTSNTVTTDFKIVDDSKTYLWITNNEIALYNLKEPTSSNHAATKSYADGKVGKTGDESVSGKKTFTSSMYANQYIYLEKSSSNSNGLLRRDTIEAMIAASGGSYKITQSSGNYYIEST